MNERTTAHKLLLERFVTQPIRLFERVIAHGEEVIIDFGILDECFRRAGKTLEGFEATKKPNGYKTAGVLCFWIRKLKPFRLGESVSISKKARLCNEAIAFLTGYEFIKGYMTAKVKSDKQPKLDAQYINDFIASLRYHSYSPHALVQIYESLAK